MLTFVDFFAGIGGIRMGLEQAGMKCVYSCEKDKFAKKTYAANFNEVEISDITTLSEEDILNIPDFDLFAGGFPCQPFSISGKQQGFKDQTRGTLFFDILRIISIKKPKAIFLENVANLAIHDKGRTFAIIIESLFGLGYDVYSSVLNSRNYGLPQNRERTYIVCFRADLGLDKEFDFPEPINSNVCIKDILEKDNVENIEYLDPSRYTLLSEDKVKISPNGMIFSGYLNKAFRKNGVKGRDINTSAVHKQCNRIYSDKGVHQCLCASELSGRYFILTDAGVRKLSLLECFRLQGFPDGFKKVVSNTQLYKQIGNSVSVPVIKAVGIEIADMLGEA